MTMHCWTGLQEWAEETHGFNTSNYWSALGVVEGGLGSATCMLDLDHKSDHDFTPDKDIHITFASEERTA